MNRTIIESCKPIIAPATILIAAYLLLAGACWCILIALRDQHPQEALLPGLCFLLSLIAMAKSAKEIVSWQKERARWKNTRQQEARQHDYKAIGAFLEKLADEVPEKFVDGIRAARIISTHGETTRLSNLFLNVKMDSKKKVALTLSLIKLIDKFEFEAVNRDSLLKNIASKMVNECNSQYDPQKAYKELLELLEKKGVAEEMNPHLKKVREVLENGWGRELSTIERLAISLQ